MNGTEKDGEKDKADKPIKDNFEFVSLKLRKLTSALYLVTNFLSDQDPLKWKLRKAALDALSETLAGKLALTRVSQIISFIEVALTNPGVSHMNFSVLKREYAELQNRIFEFQIPAALPQSGVPGAEPKTISEPQFKAPSSKPQPPNSSKNPRRETILKFIKTHGWSSIKDIARLLPDVSGKTVQRELSSLVEQGILRREGDRRWSRYQLAS